MAEIKKASPSEGLIRENFDPQEIAKSYEKSGRVDAISVLTESKYFQGDLKFIKDVKKVTSVPIFRKDFIFDEYQIYESFLAEADALLLIVAILKPKKLAHLIRLTSSLGLNCLVETHSQKEIEIALKAGAKIIGINARNLKTFKLNKELFEKLAPIIPKNIVKVAESGLKSPTEVQKVYREGANAILIGTSIMKSKNVRKAIEKLTNLI